MSTDQTQTPPQSPPAVPTPATPPTTHTTGPSPVAERLGSVWNDFKSGKLVSYRLMAILLVLIAAGGLGAYLWTEGRTADSAKWMTLEDANTMEKLDEIIKNSPDTPYGRAARLHRARVKNGPQGIEASRQPGGQAQAIQNIEAAREDFQKLIDDKEVGLPEKMLCYRGLACGEAALIGLEKHGAKGSIDNLIKYLDKLGEMDEKAPWCVKAREFSANLKNPAKPTRDELAKIQQELYDTPSLPPIGGDFGAPGMGPGPGPLGGIPGHATF